MLFDTDILIWIQKGNKKAANLAANETFRYVSIQTYMKLFQRARSKKDHQGYGKKVVVCCQDHRTWLELMSFTQCVE